MPASYVRRGMGGEHVTVQTPVLSGLEPEAFWGYFAALTRIARPSRQEEAVSDHSFQLPLQVARISTALVGIAIVAVFH